MILSQTGGSEPDSGRAGLFPTKSPGNPPPYYIASEALASGSVGLAAALPPAKRAASKGKAPASQITGASVLRSPSPPATTEGGASMSPIRVDFQSEGGAGGHVPDSVCFANHLIIITACGPLVCRGGICICNSTGSG